MNRRILHWPWPLLALAVLLAAGCAAVGDARTAVPPLSVAPVDLDRATAPTGRVGRLRFAGGLALASRDPRFGGFSGLAVGAGGESLTAISDHGWFWRAQPVYAGGELVGLKGGEFGRLAGPDGAALHLDRTADAEELEAVPGGMAVSFEHGARIYVYPGGDFRAAPRALPLPPWLADAPANKGLEAMARLGGGRLLAVCERHGPGMLNLAGIWDGSAWQRLYFKRRGDYLPTAAAPLADGGVLFLERRYDPMRGAAARISAVPASLVRPGLVMMPETWAELTPPHPVDNFEGLALARRGRETWLYMVSDDNYSPLQRTLLLAFVVEKGGK